MDPFYTVSKDIGSMDKDHLGSWGDILEEDNNLAGCN
jgi:hypothetical protein